MAKYQLPSVKQNMDPSEFGWQPSVEVLVRIAGEGIFRTGRFYHGQKVWHVSGIRRTLSIADIEEWWSLPTIGSGSQTLKPQSKSSPQDNLDLFS